MTVLLTSKKGLLLKSFFVLSLMVSQVSAKTLIFQSSESSSSVDSSQKSTVTPASTQSPPSPQSASPQPSVNSELFFIVEQLKQEVMLLRGLVEEKDYQLRQMQELSKDRYRDMDQRLQELSRKLADMEKGQGSTVISSGSSGESGIVGSVVVPVAGVGEVVPVQGGAASVVAVDGAEEQTEEQKVAYQNAYNFVKNKDFPQAIDALHAYVEKYPEGDLTGNAFYWLGEVYLVLPKLEQAKQAFSIVVKTFPGHRKLPDAMYKLAVAMDRLQDPAGAEYYLKQVQQQFPDSTAAKLAENYTISR